MNLLSFIVFVTYFSENAFQTNITVLDSKDFLTKLLELHRQHCGETATCGSSEHVEPSEFVIPVPCCLPCSCLPSCVENQNCCPFSNNETLTESVFSSRLDNNVQDNQSNLSQFGLHSVNKDIVKWNRSDEYTTELHGNDTKDPELLPNVERNRTNEQCIRAQALDRPNWYIDSQAYMMVTTCPRGFKDEIVNEKCAAGMLDVELRDMIPVTSKLSGLTYKNIHCLVCNEKLRAENIIEWSAEIVSKGAFRWHAFFLSPDFVLDNLIANVQGFGNIHFKPGDEGLTRQCKTYMYDIIICNQTGLWDVYNDLLESLCLDGYQLPIMSRIKKLFYTFKNIACFHCNTGRDESENSLSCGYFDYQDQSSTTFSSTLNIGSVVANYKNKRKVVTAPYIDHDVVRQMQYQGCPNGKIYLLVRINVYVEHIFF